MLNEKGEQEGCRVQMLNHVDNTHTNAIEVLGQNCC